MKTNTISMLNKIRKQETFMFFFVHLMSVLLVIMPISPAFSAVPDSQIIKVASTGGEYQHSSEPPLVEQNAGEKSVDNSGLYKTDITNDGEVVLAPNSSDVEISGIIGKDDGTYFDDPTDNLFTFNLAQIPGDNQDLYLEYDVFGVSDLASVNRNINDGLGRGGCLIVKDNHWSKLVEKITGEDLRTGLNRIWFSAQNEGGYSYKVKNVRVFTSNKISTSPIDFIQDNVKSYGGKIYLAGYNSDPEINVTILDREYSLKEGFFELVVDQAIPQSELLVKSDNGDVLNSLKVQQIIDRPDLEYPIESRPDVRSFTIDPLIDNSLSYDAVQLKIPSNSMDENITVTINGLRFNDLPGTPAEMVNVTAGYSGYRMLPHGYHFKKSPAIVELTYDENKIPAGYTAKDIQTFYYDLEKEQWMVLEKDSVLTDKKVIRSKTEHFTDFINGIIKVPESPETGNYTPTTLSDIKAADPTAQIVSIAPPEPNNMGSLTTSFPLKLPAGRAGMQPNLSVNYNSDGGNGWMGLGWDIPMSGVGLDTRWGAPRYDSLNETEIYTLDGSMLTLKLDDGTTTNPNRDEIIKRNQNDNRLFFSRIEGAYNEIIRHGTAPENYWWEVIDKMGNKSYYGGYGNVVHNNAVIRTQDTTHGNIAYWALYRTEDLNGNYIEYTYENNYGIDLLGKPGHGGNEFYLKEIQYTKSTKQKAPEAYYKVEFDRNKYTIPTSQTLPLRRDIQVSAREGLLRVTKDQLTEIRISLVTKDETFPIRSYRFDYQQSNLKFFKQLLVKISEYDATGNLFYSNKMEYETKGANGGMLSNGNFIDDDIINADNAGDNITGGIVLANPNISGLIGLTLSEQIANKGSLLGTTTSIGGNVGVYIGIGPGSSSSKINSIGISGGGSLSNTQGKISLFDINGDGKADKVFKNNGSVYYRENLGIYNNKLNFSDPKSITGINSFSSTLSYSLSIGAEAHALGLICLGYRFTKSKSNTKTFLSDINGDGLIDVVQKGKAKFNLGLTQNELKFSSDNTNTPNPVLGGAVSGDIISDITTETMEQLDDENPPYDVVKRWVAPKDGHVNISGIVQLNPDIDPNTGIPTPDNNDFFNDFDGIQVSIQKNDGPVLRNKIITPSFTQGNNGQIIVNPTIEELAFDNLEVTKGDRIYFRAQSRIEGSYDKVVWDPEVTYVGETVLDANGHRYFSAPASAGFLLSDSVITRLNNNCLLDWDTIYLNNMTDDVVLYIMQCFYDASDPDLIVGSHGYTAYYNHITHDLSNFQGIGGGLPTAFAAGSGLYFSVLSNSNVDWGSIKWKPVLTPVDTNLSDQTQYGVIDYKVFNTKVNPVISRIYNIETNVPVSIVPYFSQSAFASLSQGLYKFNLVVKNTNKRVIGKSYVDIKVLPFHQVQITGNDPLLITNDLTENIFVEFYSESLNAAMLGNDQTSISASVIQTNPGNGSQPSYSTPTPGPFACQNNFIRNIFINDILKYTGSVCSPYYSNLFNNNPASINTNSEINIKVDLNTAGNVPQGFAAVWIDFNRDGIINNSEFFSTGASGYSHSFRIQVPSDALTGRTIIRVRGGNNSQYTIANFFNDGILSGNVRDLSAIVIGFRGISTDIYSKSSDHLFGPNWLNWGQFAYHGGIVIQRGCDPNPDNDDEIRRKPCTDGNGNVIITGRYGYNEFGEIKPIDELVLNENQNSDLTECDQYTNEEDKINCLRNQSNESSFSTKRFIKMAVDPDRQIWVANTVDIYVEGSNFSTSRLGVKNLNEVYTDISNIVATDPCGSTDISVKALCNEATSHSITGGFEIQGVASQGLNFAYSNNWNTLSYMDMNGDGYPDVLTKNKIQYTGLTGKLSQTVEHGLGRVTEGIGYNAGASVSGTYLTANAKGKDAKNPQTATQVQASGKALINLDAGLGKDFTNSFWLDINGDGLQDRIIIDDKIINVRMNMGYSFGDEILWDNGSSANIHYGANQYNFGGGLGFSIKDDSYSGGLSGSVSKGHTEDDFLDINGDGLPDLLQKHENDNNIYYRLNTGNGFDNVIHSIAGDIAVNRTIGEGINASVSFPIFTMLVARIMMTISIGVEHSLTRTEKSISDVNGDGFPDMLSTDRTDSDGDVDIRLSNIGSVNLLKKVSTPLGGYWEVRYDRVGNTYDMPQSKYVVDTIIIYDAFTADEKPSGSGNDYTYSWNVTTVKYEFPQQDRREKDFLGFRMVTVRQHPAFNISSASPSAEDITQAAKNASGTTYRYTEQEFHNTNYYLKGMLKRESLFSGGGTEWTRNVTLYGIFERSQYCTSAQTCPVTGSFDIDSYNLNNLNYDQVKYKDVVISPDDHLTCTDLDKRSLFVAPVATISYISEGNINNAITTATRFEEYDEYGNIKKFRDYGGKSSDVYTAELTYYYSVGSIRNAKGYPEFIRIKDTDGNLMRERQAKYDGNGDLRQVFITLNGSQKSQIDLDYDEFGNIYKMTNQKSINYSDWSKYFLAYTYDDVLQTYPVKVEDAFGYESTTKYNYLFGIPVYSDDMNGQPMRSRIDDRGRIIEVTGPDELFNEGLNGDSGPAWTIRFEYEHESFVNDMLTNQGFDFYDQNHTKVYDAAGTFDARDPGLPLLNNVKHLAVTRHFDPEYKSSPDAINSSNQILTVTMVDGMGKVIQVKKSSSVFQVATQGNVPNDLNNDFVWASPGKEKFDKYGRAIEEYYPTVQNIGSFVFNNPSDLPPYWDKYDNAIDVNPPSCTAGYDVLDRPHSKTVPGESLQTTIQYSLEDHLFKTTVTNELQQVSKVFTDIRKKTIRTVQVSQTDGDIVTAFDYDPVGQLIKVTDAEGFETQSEYDLGGRRIAYKHPDKGVTKYTYDEAGNLTRMESSNLLLKGKSVNYKYTYNRLNAIEYPEFPENNVKYFYGSAGNSEAANNNSVGRIWYQVDASGTQYLKYGKLGEVTLNRRSVAVPGDRVYWFQTEWTYDTWNRVQTIKYPDEELVSYHYNRGGDLHSITSEKPGLQTPPKDIISQLGYDRFGQRVYLRYGNGTETTYEYEAARRRLHNLKVRNIGDSDWGSGQGTTERTFIDNIYTYDVLGNITDLANNTVNLPGVEEIGGLSSQQYQYDDLNRLTSAQGAFVGNTELPGQGVYGMQRYTLGMSYDKMYRINSKNQLHEKNYSNDGQTPAGNWNGIEKSSYQFNYSNYGTSSRTLEGYSYLQPHALSTLQENPICGTPPPGIDTRIKQHNYLYDANGNMTTEIVTATASDTIRQNLWDENDRLRAVDLNPSGSMAHPVAIYTYDAAGERVLKQNSTCIAVYENAIRTGFEARNDFMLYPNGLIVVRPANDGTGEMRYTKHYYSGATRVSSKIGTTTNLGAFLRDWTLMENSGEFSENPVLDSKEQLHKAEQGVRRVFANFGIDAGVTAGNDVFNPVFAYEHQNSEPDHYYYHPDHLGSSSYISNASGIVNQHMEYFAFGENFVDEHLNSYNSPYRFNSKELDEETGLYYYGARYYDPRVSLWLGVDALTEKFPNKSAYSYCANNPIKLIDPDGRSPKIPPSYYMNSQGFWIAGDESFGEYIGNVAPIGGQGGYMEITKIRGSYYHKNTTNVFAKIGNYFGGDFVEHKPYDKAEESFNTELLSTALSFGVFKVGGLAFNLLKSAGGSLWKIASLQRGFVYESMLNLKGAMKTSNFPVIDAFFQGTATSIKTLDLGAKTYLKGNAVFRQLSSYIDDLAKFNGRTWGGETVKAGDITKKVLEVGIPRGASKIQIQQINKAVEYAAEKGIQLNVRIVQ